MNNLQRKAIEEAIRLLETVQARPFYPENYDSPERLKAAAKTQQTEVYADATIRTRAVEWLKSALE